MVDLNEKRVLITHTQVSNIMGSTVVASEVAAWFLQKGAQVTLYTASFGQEARLLFDQDLLEVICDGDWDCSLEDYDLVWVHSQILPVKIIEQLANSNSLSKTPAFIFNHMSCLPFSVDEHPYIDGLEEALSSLSIFVSEETRDELAKYYRAPLVDLHQEGVAERSFLIEESRRPSGVACALFPNPAPASFARIDHCSSEAIRKVAVISNHIPPELSDAIPLLVKRGINVEVVGASGNICAVTPEIIASFDAVITIGKTVQYCLVSGVPVFVYDHFGGFGYLNNCNFEKAAYANFSGRGGGCRD